MTTVRYAATIDAQVETIWKSLADIESWPRWLRVPYVSESVVIVCPEPRAAGTEFILKGSMKFRLLARIKEWQEKRMSCL